MARFMGQCFRLFLSLSPTPISLTRRCCVGMVLLVGTVKDAPLHSREYVLQKCVFVSADKWFFFATKASDQYPKIAYLFALLSFF